VTQHAIDTSRGRRKSFIGTVVSTKMDKTAVVAVERRHPHPLYRKIVRVTKRYKAHDEHNAANLGDVVRIVETRPLSKDKRWRIAATLTRGDVADLAPRDIGAPVEAFATPTPPPAPVSTEPHTDEALAIIEQDSSMDATEDPIEEAAAGEAEAEEKGA